MAKTHEIPPANDEDYLARLARYLKIATEFKSMVVDLSTGDLRDSDYFGQDLVEAEVDEDGRLDSDFQLSHGHYDVTPGKAPEIDRVKRVDTAVLLSTKEGGRRFNVNLTNILWGLLTVTYYEDRPHKPGPYEGTDDVLNRFRIEREAINPIGIHWSEINIIEALTTNILAAHSAGRLQPINEPEGCNCP